MNVTRNSGVGFLALMLTVGLLVAGCAGSGEDKGSESGKSGGTDTASASHDDHSGWWCVEHGIPEDECSMCSSRVAEECKAKGDWCEEHNRAESQCFECHPELAAKFAKLYEAKFGKKPPAPKE